MPLYPESPRGRGLVAAAFAALPAAVVAALALVAAPSQVRKAVEWLKESPRGIARSAEAARRELSGDAYAAAVAEMERRVPPGGAYAIAGDAERADVKHAVRCDLAPRTPVLLRSEGACGNWLLDRPFAPVPDLAVFVSADGTPRVVETRTLLSSLWSGLTGPEVEVPGWIDEPAEGAAVGGRVVVGGWCQERGGTPCSAVRVWVDGRELDAARIERFPRRDVEAAIPEMGDCSRAGWRAVFEPGELAPGRHCVAAALIGTGGRHRRVGPWTFTVTP
jgi:hypothetical protein